MLLISLCTVFQESWHWDINRDVYYKRSSYSG